MLYKLNYILYSYQPTIDSLSLYIMVDTTVELVWGVEILKPFGEWMLSLYAKDMGNPASSN